MTRKPFKFVPGDFVASCDSSMDHKEAANQANALLQKWIEEAPAVHATDITHECWLYWCDEARCEHTKKAKLIQIEEINGPKTN